MISTDSHPLRVTQVHISFIQSCVSSQSSSKYEAKGGDISALKDAIMPAVNAGQKNLMLSLAKFNATIESAYEESAPHKICAYI